MGNELGDDFGEFLIGLGRLAEPEVDVFFAVFSTIEFEWES